MSKEKYTHIIAVIDRSGSMREIKVDMEGGFDSFIKEQGEVEGEATLTLAQFDTEYEIVHDNIAITDVPKFELTPRGCTALLDAIGRTLSTERERINKMDEDKRPSKIICVVITDGQENASHEYNRKRVFEMVSDLEGEEDPQWDFVFLGANQDAIAEGEGMGVMRSKAMTYDATSDGTRAAFKSLSKNMTSYRCSAAGVEYAFDDNDRKTQEDMINKKSKFEKAIPSYVTELNDTK